MATSTALPLREWRLSLVEVAPDDRTRDNRHLSAMHEA